MRVAPVKTRLNRQQCRRGRLFLLLRLNTADNEYRYSEFDFQVELQEPNIKLIVNLVFIRVSLYNIIIGIRYIKYKQLCIVYTILYYVPTVEKILQIFYRFKIFRISTYLIFKLNIYILYHVVIFYSAVNQNNQNQVGKNHLLKYFNAFLRCLH